MLKNLAISALALWTPVAVAAAQQRPAIRPLGAVTAVSAEPLSGAVFARHLPSGVLVNDVQNRRLLLFDSALRSFTVVADTTAATANAYSGRVGALIPYRADSSLFVDPMSMSMLVIDPAGKVARVMSVARSQDAMTLGNAVFGAAGFDAQGRLVYRASPRLQMTRTAAGGPGGPGAREMAGTRESPDSAAITRVDLASRQLDTVGFVKISRPKVEMTRDENGRPNVSMQWNPLPVVDEWAVMADGSIAFLRGRDYHIDWVRPDGSRESSPKIPFDWQRLTDEDKTAFIDSLKAARERMIAENPALREQPAASTSITTGPGGNEARVMIMGGPVGPGGPGAPGGGMPGAVLPGGAQTNFVPASELPDYKPAFFAGAVRADDDGFLWVRTIPTKAIPGGPVYDVINGKGELVERVQLPADRTIVGFGKGGVVYLLARDGKQWKLERASVR